MTITNEKTHAELPPVVLKLLTLGAPQMSPCGRHVRILVRQANVEECDVITCFTKRGDGVELQARALISPTSAGAFEIVFSMADFEAARIFLQEEWNLHDGCDDDEEVNDDEDDDDDEDEDEE